MGAFDDLPAAGATVQAGAFDDLIPKKPTASFAASAFDDLIPKPKLTLPPTSIPRNADELGAQNMAAQLAADESFRQRAGLDRNQWAQQKTQRAGEIDEHALDPDTAETTLGAAGVSILRKLAGTPDESLLKFKPEDFQALDRNPVLGNVKVLPAPVSGDTAKTLAAALSIDPANAPDAREVARVTGASPMTASAVSSAGRGAQGLAQFLTSPSGIAQTAAAANPAGIVIRAKWLYDMAGAGGASLGNISVLLQKYHNDPQSFTADDLQQLNDETVNGAAMLLMAGKMGEHEFTKATGLPAPVIGNKSARMGKYLGDILNRQPLDGKMISGVPMQEDRNVGAPAGTTFEVQPESKAPFGSPENPVKIAAKPAGAFDDLIPTPQPAAPNVVAAGIEQARAENGAANEVLQQIQQNAVPERPATVEPPVDLTNLESVIKGNQLAPKPKAESGNLESGNAESTAQIQPPAEVPAPTTPAASSVKPEHVAEAEQIIDAQAKAGQVSPGEALAMKADVRRQAAKAESGNNFTAENAQSAEPAVFESHKNPEQNQAVADVQPTAGVSVTHKVSESTAPKPQFKDGQRVAVTLSKRAGAKEHMARIVQLQPDGSALVRVIGEKTYRTLPAEQIHLTKTDVARLDKAQEIADLGEQGPQAKADADEFNRLVADYGFRDELKWFPPEASGRNFETKGQAIEANNLRKAGIENALRDVGADASNAVSIEERAKALPALEALIRRTFGDEANREIDSRRRLKEFNRRDEPTPEQRQQRIAADASIVRRILAANPRSRELRDIRVVGEANPAGKTGRAGAGPRESSGFETAAGRDRSGAGAGDAEVAGRRNLPGQLNRTGEAALRELERIFGVRIIPVESISGGPVPFNGFKDGRSNVILIDSRNERPMQAIAGHELAHHMMAVSPELYRAMERAILPLVHNERGYMKIMAARRDAMTEETFNKELVADFIGDCFTKPEFLQKLAAREPEIFRRFARLAVQWLDKLIAKARALAGYDTNQFISDLESARAVAAEALAKFGRERVTGIREESGNAGKAESGNEFSRKPQDEIGIINGSAAEKWADNVIENGKTRLHMGLDPELLAAYAVKGAAFVERGMTDFAQWSGEMVNKFGEKIRPHLEDVWRETRFQIARNFNERTGTDREGSMQEARGKARGNSNGGGYVGYSMSVRANNAYAEGKLPASKGAKEIGISTELFRAIFQPSEWHHTSKHFNSTDFYAMPSIWERIAREPEISLRIREEVKSPAKKQEWWHRAVEARINNMYERLGEDHPSSWVNRPAEFTNRKAGRSERLQELGKKFAGGDFTTMQALEKRLADKPLTDANYQAEFQKVQAEANRVANVAAIQKQVEALFPQEMRWSQSSGGGGIQYANYALKRFRPLSKAIAGQILDEGGTVTPERVAAGLKANAALASGAAGIKTPLETPSHVSELEASRTIAGSLKNAANQIQTESTMVTGESVKPQSENPVNESLFSRKPLAEMGDFFSAPESVEQQKARMAEEKAKAESGKRKAEMQDKAQRRLVGEDVDTTAEMFGGSENAGSRVDKAGQQSLFSRKPLDEMQTGSKQERNAANWIRNFLWDKGELDDNVNDSLQTLPPVSYRIPDIEQALRRNGENRTWDEIVADEGDTPTKFNPQGATIYDWAKQHHGTTDDIGEAGYVLPDGTMLDFSARRDGGGGSRSLDHRNIFFPGRPNDGYEAMRKFIESGAVRIDVSGAVDLAKSPTGSQISRLRELGENAGSLSVDMKDGDRKASFQTENIERGIGMIRRFYRGEDLPEHQSFFSRKPLAEMGEDAPVWRSNIEDALQSWQNRGTPQQLLAHLQKTRGAMDEAEWIGLDDWLAARGNSVTKAEVADFVARNKVDVQEVEIGQGGVLARQRLERLNQEMANSMPQLAYENGFSQLDAANLPWRLRDGRVKVSDLPEPMQESAQKFVDAAKAWEEESNKPVEKEPKFANYQLPGGENYRELLLTLPEQPKEPDTSKWTVRFDKLSEQSAQNLRQGRVPEPPQGFGGYRVYDESGKVIDGSYRPKTPEAAMELAKETFKQLQKERGGFRSSHFDEPNILAHVRFNERTDADGKRVLHLEEVQSDWHQKGRKEGYMKQNPTPKDVKDFFGYSDAFWQEMGAEGQKSAMAEYKSGEDYIKKGTVPDAPFKQTWPMLAMKRMIRYAADNGFDRITWTTGEQQAERYDLSKKISRVVYSDGTLNAYGLNGENVLRKPSIKESEIEDYIGKDAAEKLLTKPGAYKEISGLDLKVGGEGMKGFYDKILPSEVNKFVKKWGGRVGQGKIPTAEFANSKTGDAWVVIDNYGDPVYAGDKAGAEKIIARHEGENWQIKKDWRKEGSELVHSLDITPAMKDAAQEGLPMFSRKPESEMGVGADDWRAIGQQMLDAQAALKQAIADVVNSHPGSDRAPLKAARDRAAATYRNLERQIYASPSYAEHLISRGDEVYRQLKAITQKADFTPTPDGLFGYEDRMTAKLTPDEITRARALSDEWFAINQEMDKVRKKVLSAAYTRMFPEPTTPDTGKPTLDVADEWLRSKIERTPVETLARDITTVEDTLKDKLAELPARVGDAYRATRRGMEQVANWPRTWDGKEVISYTKNAAENKAQILANQASRTVLHELNRAFGLPAETRDAGREMALTMAVEAGDKATLDLMRNTIETSQHARTKWGREALRAIAYAEKHFERMQPVVDLYTKISDAQVAAENASGIKTLHREQGYVFHLHDMDEHWLHLDMGDGAGGGASNPFKNVRDYATYADAIANGLNPRSMNAVDLMHRRLALGQKLINYRAWERGLEKVNDPATGLPLAAPVEIRIRADGTEIQNVPQGYTKMMFAGQTFGIHKAYAPIFRALTSESALRNGGWGYLMKAASTAKHGMLLFDTFHLGRLAFWNSVARGAGDGAGSLLPGLPTYRKGLTLLDTTDSDIRRMVETGDLKQADADALLAQRKTLNLLLNHGLNVGSIGDNIYTDWVQKLPVAGTFNKWLFEQYQRGAMTEVALIEFNRQKAMHPEWTPEQTARATAKAVNVRFGNLNAESWVKNKTIGDLLRVFMLAPQWNEALIRAEVEAVKDAGRLIASVPKTGQIEMVKKMENGQEILVPKRRMPSIGMMGRAVATAFVGQFIANQLINYGTRGIPTWENPEEGFEAKISAYIPDAAGGPGFFLNPMTLPMEISHLLIKGYERTGTLAGSIGEALKSRESSFGRFIHTYATGKGRAGETAHGTLDRVLLAGSEAAPLPIAGSALYHMGKQVATGESAQQYPGQFQRQAMQTFGVKPDSAPSPEQRIQNLAKEWLRHNADQKLRLRQQQRDDNTFHGDYMALDQLLRAGNTADAKKELARLLLEKKPDTIKRRYEQRDDGRFTGSLETDKAFVRTLTPEQREQYTAALKERTRIKNLVFRMLAGGN